MNAENFQACALWGAVAAAAIVAGGEYLHARRVARIAALAFGPGGRARLWTRVAPVVRTLAAAGAVWSLVTLLSLGGLGREHETKGGAGKRLMVLLDVSPSMLLPDGGENRSETRNARASAVLKSVLDRVSGDRVRFTVGGFYTETRLLVSDCRDRELILHLASGTPFHITYEPGKTDLIKCLNQAGDIMKDWERKSTTLLVLSDGDSVAPTGLRPMPSSVSDVIFAGVGDAARGTFIDGHLSRQDNATLSQLARRLRGNYYDCNARQIPGAALANLNAEQSGPGLLKTDRRTLALAILAVSAAALCLLPPLLDYFGAPRRRRVAAAT